MQSLPAHYANTAMGIADNAEQGGDATGCPAAHCFHATGTKCAEPALLFRLKCNIFAGYKIFFMSVLTQTH